MAILLAVRLDNLLLDFYIGSSSSILMLLFCIALLLKAYFILCLHINVLSLAFWTSGLNFDLPLPFTGCWGL